MFFLQLIYLVAANGQAVPTTALIMLGAIYGLQAIIYILHRKFEHIGQFSRSHHLEHSLTRRAPRLDAGLHSRYSAIQFHSPARQFLADGQFQLVRRSFPGLAHSLTHRSKGDLLVRSSERKDRGSSFMYASLASSPQTFLTVSFSQDEGKFDPASIPLKSWQDFENELWEQVRRSIPSSRTTVDEFASQNSNQSIGSLIAASKREDNDSRYGRDSTYNMAPSVSYGGNGGEDSPRRSLAFDRQSQFGPRSNNGGSQYQGSNYGGTQYGNSGEESPGANSGFYDNGTHTRSGSNLAMNEDFGHSRPPSMAFTNTRNSRAMSPGPRNFGQLPPDHVIINDIQISQSPCLSSLPLCTDTIVAVLASANLQTLTKKGVRQELESMYGLSLGEKKAMVNSTIEAALGLN